MDRKRVQEAERFRALIKQHNISFEGVVEPSQWPRQHAEIFQRVHEVDRIFYQEELVKMRYDEERLIGWRGRVEEIRRLAWQCRYQLSNESTWRHKLEPKVLDRFERRHYCLRCGKRLWAIEFRSFRAIATEDERQRELAGDQIQCNGQHAEPEPLRTQDTNASNGPFEIKTDELVYQFSEDELKLKRVRNHLPDRIHGLALTASFQRVIDLARGTRHSPFLGNHLIYPFLVMEAKSEKNNPGFESIEAQTAFPIRLLLKIQAQLVKEDGEPFDPLVWFLSHVGDSWRVYGCTLERENGSLFRVYELWEGTLLSHDKALRLLIIVDIICDWALRYRRDVFRCLRKGFERALRDLTPAMSTLSTQDEAGTPVSQDPPFADPEHDASSSSSEIFKIIDHDSEMREDVAEDRSGDDLQPFQSLSYEFEKDAVVEISDGSKAKTKIRSIDFVEFRFCHVQMPSKNRVSFDDVNSVQHSSIVQAANLVGVCFQEVAPILISLEGVDILHEAWLGEAPENPCDEDLPCWTWIFFQTFFRHSDCQLIRQLTCVTMTIEGWKALEVLAGKHIQIVETPLHQCRCLSEAASAVRILRREDAASMAIAQVEAHLVLGSKFTDIEQHFLWQQIPQLKLGPNMEVSGGTLLVYWLNELQNSLGVAVPQPKFVPMEVIPGTSPCPLTAPPGWKNIITGTDSLILISEAQSAISLLTVRPPLVDDEHDLNDSYRNTIINKVAHPRHIFSSAEKEWVCLFESTSQIPWLIQKVLLRWASLL